MNNKLIDLIKPAIITGLFFMIYNPNIKISNVSHLNYSRNYFVTNICTDNSSLNAREFQALRREDLYVLLERLAEE